MAVAGGLAFPGARDAEAIGGYTYTELICQEYGQQPRRYQVRDPIIGSDWRNDGGWAIVLIRGANFRKAEYQFSPITDRTNSEALGGAGTRAVMLSWVGTGWNPNPQQLVGADDNGVWENPDAWGIRSGTLLVAQDGTQGFVTTRYYGSAVVVDRNNNGVLDEGDMATAAEMGISLPGSSYYADKRVITRVVAPLHYGGSYIRWANMRWCR